jgi:hypothetical protein
MFVMNRGCQTSFFIFLILDDFLSQNCPFHDKSVTQFGHPILVYKILKAKFFFAI